MEGNIIAATVSLIRSQQDALPKYSTAGKIHAVADGAPININYHMISSEQTLRN